MDLGNLLSIDVGLPWIAILVPAFTISIIIIFVSRGKKRPEDAEIDAEKELDRGFHSLLPMYTWKEFSGRIDTDHKWIIINNKICKLLIHADDVTHLLKKHPGGRAIVLSMIGLDASRFFGNSRYPIDGVHCHSRLARYLLVKIAVGHIQVNGKEQTGSQEAHSAHNSIQRSVRNEDTGSRNGTMLTNRHTSVNVDRMSKLPGTPSGGRMLSRRSSYTTPPQSETDVQILQEYRPTPNRFKEYTMISKAVANKPGAKFKVLHISFPLPGVYKNPPGAHVLFQYMGADESVVTRAYTPIHHLNKFQIDFFIKIYDKGAMSTYIEEMNSIRISFPSTKDSEVYCNETKDKCWNNLGIIAGGSGLTFALSMIEFHLFQAKMRTPDFKPMKIHLVNINHAVEDIFGEEILKELESSSSGILTITQVVTIQPEVPFNGLVGHISGSDLRQRMPSSDSFPDSAIYICGFVLSAKAIDLLR